MELERKRHELLREAIKVEVETVIRASLTLDTNQVLTDALLACPTDRRKDFETIAEVLEGYRATLMNASHCIQLNHDKRTRHGQV